MRSLKTTDVLVLQNLFNEKYRKSIPKRLQLFLEQEPKADYNFYCILHGLPGDEKRAATLHKYVQKKVKEELGYRIPTFILMLDFYIIVAVIASFGTAVTRYNQWLFSNGDPPPNIDVLLWVVIGGGIYFLLREVMQAFSFYSIGFFMTYLRDRTNHVDMICIVLMIVWPILMLKECGTAQKEVFRSLSTLAAGFLFLLVFSFLKRISKDFAVFVQGLIAVSKRLSTFLVVLAIIITAFALMFYSMFIGASDPGLFGDFGSSWFEVYNMILGNYGPDDIFGINPENYKYNGSAQNNSSYNNLTTVETTQIQHMLDLSIMSPPTLSQTTQINLFFMACEYFLQMFLFIYFS